MFNPVEFRKYADDHGLAAKTESFLRHCYENNIDPSEAFNLPAAGSRSRDLQCAAPAPTPIPLSNPEFMCNVGSMNAAAEYHVSRVKSGTARTIPAPHVKDSLAFKVLVDWSLGPDVLAFSADNAHSSALIHAVAITATNNIGHLDGENTAALQAGPWVGHGAPASQAYDAGQKMLNSLAVALFCKRALTLKDASFWRSCIDESKLNSLWSSFVTDHTTTVHASRLVFAVWLRKLNFPFPVAIRHNSANLSPAAVELMTEFEQAFIDWAIDCLPRLLLEYFNAYPTPLLMTLLALRLVCDEDKFATFESAFKDFCVSMKSESIYDQVMKQDYWNFSLFNQSLLDALANGSANVDGPLTASCNQEQVYGDSVTQHHYRGDEFQSFLVNDATPLDLTTGTVPRDLMYNSTFGIQNSCFVAGTKIALEDGTTASIEDLQPGSSILNANGEVSIVGHLVRSSTSASSLYGYNDEEPWFTSSHVFESTHIGPVAIDYKTALRENEEIAVHPLRRGDFLIKYGTDGHGPKSHERIRYWGRKNRRVNGAAGGDDDLPVFGLFIRTGLKSYRANGYSVYATYPDISLEDLASRQDRLTRPDALCKIMADARPIVDEMYSEGHSAHMTDLASGRLDDPDVCRDMRDQAAATSARRNNHINVASKLVYRADSRVEQYFKHIHLDRGVVFVDGKVVPAPHVAGREATFLLPNKDVRVYLELHEALHTGIGVLVEYTDSTRKQKKWSTLFRLAPDGYVENTQSSNVLSRDVDDGTKSGDLFKGNIPDDAFPIIVRTFTVKDTAKAADVEYTYKDDVTQQEKTQKLTPTIEELTWSLGESLKYANSPWLHLNYSFTDDTGFSNSQDLVVQGAIEIDKQGIPVFVFEHGAMAPSLPPIGFLPQSLYTKVVLNLNDMNGLFGTVYRGACKEVTTKNPKTNKQQTVEVYPDDQKFSFGTPNTPVSVPAAQVTGNRTGPLWYAKQTPLVAQSLALAGQYFADPQKAVPKASGSELKRPFPRDLREHLSDVMQNEFALAAAAPKPTQVQIDDAVQVLMQVQAVSDKTLQKWNANLTTSVIKSTMDPDTSMAILGTSPPPITDPLLKEALAVPDAKSIATRLGNCMLVNCLGGAQSSFPIPDYHTKNLQVSYFYSGPAKDQGKVTDPDKLNVAKCLSAIPAWKTVNNKINIAAFASNCSGQVQSGLPIWGSSTTDAAANPLAQAAGKVYFTRKAAMAWAIALAISNGQNEARETCYFVLRTLGFPQQAQTFWNMVTLAPMYSNTLHIDPVKAVGTTQKDHDSAKDFFAQFYKDLSTQLQAGKWNSKTVSAAARKIQNDFTTAMKKYSNEQFTDFMNSFLATMPLIMVSAMSQYGTVGMLAGNLVEYCFSQGAQKLGMSFTKGFTRAVFTDCFAGMVGASLGAMCLVLSIKGLNLGNLTPDQKIKAYGQIVAGSAASLGGLIDLFRICASTGTAAFRKAQCALVVRRCMSVSGDTAVDFSLAADRIANCFPRSGRLRTNAQARLVERYSTDDYYSEYAESTASYDDPFDHEPWNEDEGLASDYFGRTAARSDPGPAIANEWEDQVGVGSTSIDEAANDMVDMLDELSAMGKPLIEATDVVFQGWLTGKQLLFRLAPKFAGFLMVAGLTVMATMDAISFKTELGTSEPWGEKTLSGISLASEAIGVVAGGFMVMGAGTAALGTVAVGGFLLTIPGPVMIIGLLVALAGVIASIVKKKCYPPKQPGQKIRDFIANIPNWTSELPTAPDGWAPPMATNKDTKSA